MNFHCFKYENKPLISNLSIKQIGGVSQIRCFIRNKYIQLTDEEKVRQTFLWFLKYGSKYAEVWTQKIHIEVETFDIDVSLSLKLNIDGLKTISLFFIIETKKDTYNILDNSSADEQLCKYLLRKSCYDGLLFNAYSAIHLKLNPKNRNITKINFNDLNEVEDLINALLAIHEQQMNAHKELFYRATKGDYYAFKSLIKFYGRRCTITFEYVRKNNLTRVRGFLFKNENEQISFNVRNIYTKKKQILTEINFRGIVSITDSTW